MKKRRPGSRNIRKLIGEYIADKDVVGDREVALHVIDKVLRELKVTRKVYDRSEYAHPVLWRGAFSWSRDVMKRTGAGAAGGSGGADGGDDEEQPSLYPNFSEHCWVADHPAGGSIYKVRSKLTRDEYGLWIEHLDKTEARLHKRIVRFKAEYEFALPFWGQGELFGEAYRRARNASTSS